MALAHGQSVVHLSIAGIAAEKGNVKEKKKTKTCGSKENDSCS